MSKIIQSLWSITTIAAIGLIVTAGMTTSQNVAATEDHSHMSETEHSHMETEQKTRTSTVEERNELRTKTESVTQERKVVVREKLSAAKLKVCEHRQATITDRTKRIADRGAKHVALLTTIADRVKAFYVSKGNTLENYDALIADVAAKKAAAETAVQTITASTSDFKCSDGNPKQSMEGFKANVTLRHVAVKDYQIAVKNLIVGVKSVNATAPPTNKENE
jgi:hypothetical protein